jgi:hypothetical protein
MFARFMLLSLRSRGAAPRPHEDARLPLKDPPPSPALGARGTRRAGPHTHEESAYECVFSAKVGRQKAAGWTAAA